MANVNAPFGFKPVRYLNGAPWNGQARYYNVNSGNGGALAVGDPVCTSGAADTYGVMGVSIGIAGSPIRGVIVGTGTGIATSTATAGLGLPGGMGGNPTSQQTTVIPATKATDYYVLVVDDPQVIFWCMEQYSGTAFTSAEAGLNCNFDAGANNGYISQYVLDNGTEAVTAALNVRLLGLAQIPNNTYGVGAIWEVMINNHELRQGAVGV